MNVIVKRGYVPSDTKEFNKDSLILLSRAQQDILYLLNRGYPMKNASTFVGNHYVLSERQRLALVRATSSTETLVFRKQKCLTEDFENQIVYVDALNIIITLEVALSDSTLLRCMDGSIRDLAGLRGTYRLIDKTDIAIRLIGEELKAMKVKKAVFYLDSPVSNTGRLKQRIQELLEQYTFEVTTELVNNADTILEKMDYVISSDAIILNKCVSWINFVYKITKTYLPETGYIDLSMQDMDPPLFLT
jgi:hypothetical protein